MLRCVDGLAYFADARCDAGRRLVVNHAHGLDRMTCVFRETLLDGRGVGAVPPVAGQEFSDQPQAGREFLPEHGELAGLAHQDAIAR